MCGPESASSRDGRMEPNRFMFCALLLHWAGTAEEELHVNNFFSVIILHVASLKSTLSLSGNVDVHIATACFDNTSINTVL